MKDNSGIIKLYQDLEFEQFVKIFKRVNDPNCDRSNVFSMQVDLEAD